jgi:hypothetical protein
MSEESPVLEAVLADDRVTRANFLSHFETEAREFASNMESAFGRWQRIDAMVRERRQPTDDYACVAAITFTSISLLIQSVQCFLGGQAMASGNLVRQSIESVAVAILCADQQSSVRRSFMAQQYSSTGALNQIRKHCKRFDLNPDGIEKLIQAKRFYDKLSHPTALTLAHGVEFGSSVSFIGAAFDPAKLDGYRGAIASIVSLSSTFPSFIANVWHQLDRWHTPEGVKGTESS